MQDAPFFLAPNLTLCITWNVRMAFAMRKRYWAVMSNRPDAPALLRQEYQKWEQAQVDCYEIIRRFFVFTGSLPVAGDCLQQGIGKAQFSYPGVLIKKRELLSSDNSEHQQLVYEIEAQFLEGLEEYQEGDLVEHEI